MYVYLEQFCHTKCMCIYYTYVTLNVCVFITHVILNVCVFRTLLLCKLVRRDLVVVLTDMELINQCQNSCY